MVRYRHIKEKAILLRGKGYTLTQICEMLNIKKTTAYGWIKEILEYKKINVISDKMREVGKINSLRAKVKRDKAYKNAYEDFCENGIDKLSRDFGIIYLTEGYRKNRNCVSVINSNPKIINVSNVYICKNSLKAFRVRYILDYYPDQDLDKISNFWAEELNIDVGSIKPYFRDKGRLQGRNHASKYGNMTVAIGDTYLRCKIQALMDLIECDWDKY